MNKDRLDQKGNQGTQRGELNSRGKVPGGRKDAQDSKQEPRQDQLDDQGRQQHMGHGERKDEGRGGRPLEEGEQNEELGRPVRIGERNLRDGENERKEGGDRWTDKTEGTSRESDPVG
jgi:hypothetical protein